MEEMENRLRDCEPFVAVAQLETRVEEMEQLEVQLVQLSGLVCLRNWWWQNLARSWTSSWKAESRTWCSGAMTLLSRVENLEQRCDDIAVSLNATTNRRRPCTQHQTTTTQ